MQEGDTDELDYVKSVNTAFRILEHLQETNGCRLTELASSLGLAKSTAHRHLETLLDMEYIVKEENTYYLGFRFLELGEYTKTRKDAFRMAKQKVNELAEETDERAQLMVEEHGYSVYIFRAAGQHAVLTDPGIGKRVNIHSSSAGKAILGSLPQDRVHEIIDKRGLPELTPHTITDLDDFLSQLDTIRERGYAFNDEESIQGLRAVGVPIRGKDHEVLGALSVSGPTHRMKGDWYTEEIPDLLLGLSNELELNIRHA